jgi:hypothetical protein
MILPWTPRRPDWAAPPKTYDSLPGKRPIKNSCSSTSASRMQYYLEYRLLYCRSWYCSSTAPGLVLITDIPIAEEVVNTNIRSIVLLQSWRPVVSIQLNCKSTSIFSSVRYKLQLVEGRARLKNRLGLLVDSCTKSLQLPAISLAKYILTSAQNARQD